MFLQTCHVIDALVLDPYGDRLYWTAYDAGVIASVSLSGGSYRIEVEGLDKPRAIQFDHTNGYIFQINK